MAGMMMVVDGNGEVVAHLADAPAGSMADPRVKAQRIADDRGEPVWLVDPDADADPEAEEEGERFDPTPVTVTDEQIDQLRTEAGAAGDSVMVETCDRAIGGDSKARRECAEAIEAGSVMIDWARFDD